MPISLSNFALPNLIMVARCNQLSKLHRSPLGKMNNTSLKTENSIVKIWQVTPVYSKEVLDVQLPDAAFTLWADVKKHLDLSRY